MSTIEGLDKKIQDGYVYSLEGNFREAFRIWKNAWEIFISTAKENGVKSVEKFQKDFELEDRVELWLEDFKSSFMQFVQIDKENAKIIDAICDEYLNQFGENESLEKVRSVYKLKAEALFIEGNKKESEKVYLEYLKKDSSWTDGWISWTDCWLELGEGFKDDYKKALNILNTAIKYSKKNETKEVYERLNFIYEKMGDEDKAAEMKQRVMDFMMDESTGEFF